MRKHFEIGETAVTMIADERFIPVAEASVFRSREIIQQFIGRNPLFRLTLEPYEAPEDADPLIKRMCQATGAAGVGPMAGVAGAIAERAVMDMREAGAEQAIVDNGGDVALLLKQDANVGLYAGDRIKGIGFAVPPRDGVFGICTSSATIGPSISFGITDAATVIAENVTLADACATRLGNLVTVRSEEALKGALDDVTSIEGVEGALVVVEDLMAMKGKLPPMVRMECERSKIAKIELGTCRTTNFTGLPKGRERCI